MCLYMCIQLFCRKPLLYYYYFVFCCNTYTERKRRRCSGCNTSIIIIITYYFYWTIFFYIFSKSVFSVHLERRCFIISYDNVVKNQRALTYEMQSTLNSCLERRQYNVIGYLAELFYNRSSGGSRIIHIPKSIKNGKSINCRYNKYPCIIY